MAKKTQVAKPRSLRPPIVAVLGHVDHGKTTLLDAIRKTDVAQKEFGGITQHVGAYQVEVSTKEGKRKITFIDTPGHETFAKIRSRGAKVSDIALLVVAANDGIQPQTIESINHIKLAGIPSIVVFTKSDLEGQNPESLKKQLVKNGLKLEKYGGDTPIVSVSAKTGKGIQDLLEMIILVGEMQNIEGSPEAKLEAVIIESKVDKRSGVEASVIVQNGKINIGQEIYVGLNKAKVKALINDLGVHVSEILPGEPGKILGFSLPPAVGERISDQPYDQQTESVQPPEEKTEEELTSTAEKLKIILRTDSQNSSEALLNSLPLDKLEIISQGLGDVTDSDIWLAKTTQAFVIGFNVNVPAATLKLAQFEKVRIKTYKIIYELLKEIKEVVVSLAELETEQVFGKAKIIAEFPFNSKRVAGVKVLEGRIARGDRVIVQRDEEEIGRSLIKSIKRFKEDINKIEVGEEGGVLIDPNLDFKLGDMLLSIQS